MLLLLRVATAAIRREDDREYYTTKMDEDASLQWWSPELYISETARTVCMWAVCALVALYILMTMWYFISQWHYRRHMRRSRSRT